MTMTYDTWHYELVGDTTICGYTYSILYTDGISNMVYVRTDGSVSFYRKGVNCLDKEYKLYDFSLFPGDSIYVGLEGYGSLDTNLFVVYGGYNVTYQGVNRLVLQMEYQHPGSLGYIETMLWVEGIGSLVDPFYSLRCLHPGCEQIFELLCAESNGFQTYNNPNWSTCDTSWTVGLVEYKNFPIRAYPNPTSGSLIVEKATKAFESNAQVVLCDLRGKKLLEQNIENSGNTLVLNVGHLSNGVYILRVVQETKVILTERIVII